MAPRLLIADDLPPAVRARWQNRITLISDADWQKRDPRAAGRGFRLRVRQAGSFVVLTYDHSDRLAVELDTAPQHYAGGGEIVLLRTASGWKQVSHIAWVT